MSLFDFIFGEDAPHTVLPGDFRRMALARVSDTARLVEARTALKSAPIGDVLATAAFATPAGSVSPLFEARVDFLMACRSDDTVFVESALDGLLEAHLSQGAKSKAHAAVWADIDAMAEAARYGDIGGVDRRARLGGAADRLGGDELPLRPEFGRF